MPDFSLFLILYSARDVSQAEKAAALTDATVGLQSLSPPAAGRQLMCQGFDGRGVLHLLALWFSACEQAAPFLSLIIERGRESCGTNALMSLAPINRFTPLHCFARNCSDLSLTKMVLREHPPSLNVLNNDGRTPLRIAENRYGSSTERAVFFRAASAAYNTSNLAAFEALCGGPSPYLAREILRQEIALRAAVAICLKRSEAAPSALISRESGVALSILGRVRDADGAGHLLRYVLDFVGTRAAPYDSGWMEREYLAQAATIREQAATIKEQAAANKEQAATINELEVAIRELATANRELAVANKEQATSISEQAATISKHTE